MSNVIAAAGQYKIIEGNTPAELETAVNLFLADNPDYATAGGVAISPAGLYLQAITRKMKMQIRHSPTLSGEDNPWSWGDAPWQR